MADLLGEIGDYVWFDLDLDGRQDTEERGVAGVVVNLYLASSETKISSTKTDGDGYYLFPDLPAGTYFVEFIVSTLPLRYVITDQDVAPDHLDSDGDEVTGRTIDIVLDAGEVDHTWDLGIYVLDVSESTIVSTVTTNPPGSSPATTIPSSDTTSPTLPFTGVAGEATAGVAFVMVILGTVLLLLLQRREREIAAPAGERSTMVWDGDVLRWS